MQVPVRSLGSSDILSTDSIIPNHADGVADANDAGCADDNQAGARARLAWPDRSAAGRLVVARQDQIAL